VRLLQHQGSGELNAYHSSAVRLRLAVAVAVAVAGSVFLPTLANEAAAAVAADQDAIPEIVVTAQKRGQNINDVGMSIDAFSGDQLADRGVIDTSDLGKVVAGFSVATTGDATPVYTSAALDSKNPALALVRRSVSTSTKFHFHFPLSHKPRPLTYNG